MTRKPGEARDSNREARRRLKREYAKLYDRLLQLFAPDVAMPAARFRLPG